MEMVVSHHDRIIICASETMLCEFVSLSSFGGVIEGENDVRE